MGGEIFAAESMLELILNWPQVNGDGGGGGDINNYKEYKKY